jgi:hypothetical protein
LGLRNDASEQTYWEPMKRQNALVSITPMEKAERYVEDDMIHLMK